MYKTALIALLFLFVVFMEFGCDKDEARERDHPQVRTNAVNNITPDGARFNGTIISGDAGSVTEYGFVWGTGEYLSLETSEKLIVQEIPDGNSFSYDITYALEPMREYKVRSYVKSGEYTVYGDAVTFVSLGSQSPLITGFEPQTATWGDTITIYGENFSFKQSSNVVLFGEVDARVMESTNERLRVLVPNILSDFTSMISVEVVGNRSTSDAFFELITPGKITAADRLVATWSDTIEFTGIFPFTTHTLKVLFDNTVATLIEISEDRITAIFPNTVTYHDSIVVSLSIDGHILHAPERIHMTEPCITSLLPVAFGWGDTIFIYGVFHPAMTNNKISFSNIPATLLETGRNRIKCIVPSTNNHNVLLTNQIGEFKVAYAPEISLNGPIITGILPAKVACNQSITVKGKYFKNGCTTAKINGIESLVSEVTPTQIVVYLSNVHSNGPATFEASVCNKAVSVDNILVIANPVIHDFSPTEGTFGDLITINGEEFDPGNLMIRIGGSAPQIIEVTENRIKIKVPNYMENEYSTIAIYTRGVEIWSNTAFRILPPEVTTIQPLTGKPGDIITILGSNFNPEPQYQHVFFVEEDPGKYYPAEIVSSTANELTVRVPSLLNDSYSLRLELISFTNNYPSSFSLMSPWSFDKLIPYGQTYSTSLFFDENLLLLGGFWGNNYYLGCKQSCDLNSGDFTFIDNLQRILGGFGFVINNTGYYGLGSEHIYSGYYSGFYKVDHEGNLYYHFNSMPPSSRVYPFSFSINQKGYMGTGMNNENLLADFWEFDPATEIWTQKPDFPGGSTVGATAVVFENKAYIIDGKDLWVFDPALESWQKKSDFPGKGRELGNGIVINGKIYYGFGVEMIDPFGQQFGLHDFWQYDPMLDNWTQLTSFPAGLATSGQFCFTRNGSAYFGSGGTYISQNSNKLFKYNPADE